MRWNQLIPPHPEDRGHTRWSYMDPLIMGCYTLASQRHLVVAERSTHTELLTCEVVGDVEFGRQAHLDGGVGQAVLDGGSQQPRGANASLDVAVAVELVVQAELQRRAGVTDIDAGTGADGQVGLELVVGSDVKEREGLGCLCTGLELTAGELNGGGAILEGSTVNIDDDGATGVQPVGDSDSGGNVEASALASVLDVNHFV